MDKKDDPGFCGIDPIWVTGEKDPFWEACKQHDKYYIENMMGLREEKTSKLIDKIFWNDMEEIVQRHTGVYKARLRLKQALYYGLVRTFGMVRWPLVKGKFLD